MPDPDEPMTNEPVPLVPDETGIASGGDAGKQSGEPGELVPAEPTSKPSDKAVDDAAEAAERDERSS